MGNINMKGATAFLILFAFIAIGFLSSARSKPQGFGLSLFQVVKFQNEPCTPYLRAADPVEGICYTAEECEHPYKGKNGGICASGFGICCYDMDSSDYLY